MQGMFLNAGFMHMVWDATVSSRFELLLFAVTLIGYYLLHSSRRSMKDFHKKVDVTFEDSKDSEVIETNQEAEDASSHLACVIDLMKTGNDVQQVTAQMQMKAFFEDYPEHLFELDDAQVILDSCQCSTSDIFETVPAVLFERMKTTEEWEVLSSFLNFYLDTEQFDKACDLFELHYSTFFDLELDEHMEWRLISAAVQCSRQSLAEHLLQTSQTNAVSQITTIQKWWKGKAAILAESRVERMGNVMNRLSDMFNERFPFEDEHSDDESTCFFGDDSDCDDSSDDGEWEQTY